MAKKILVVDSNLAIQKLVEHNLSGDKFQVTCLNDGLSALDLFDKIAPDLILADYHLEGISIVRFCEKVKQKSSGKERPILLLVGPADSYDSSLLLAAGVVDFVRKPLDPKSLIEKLNDLSEETATVIDRAPKPSRSPAAETAVTPPPSPIAPEEPSSKDQAETSKIEELLGWSLPGEKRGGEVTQKTTDRIPEPDNEQTTLQAQVGRPSSAPAPKTEPPQEQPTAAPTIQQPTMDDLERTMVSTRMPTPPFPEEASPRPMNESQPPAAAPAPEAPAQTVTHQTLESAFPQLYADPQALESGAPSTGSESPPGKIGPMSPEAAEGVVQKLAREIIEKVAWDIVPSLAETRLKATPGQSAAPPPSADSLVSPDAIEAIVRKTAKEIIEKVAWDIVPSLAETLIKAELEKLKAEQSS